VAYEKNINPLTLTFVKKKKKKIDWKRKKEKVPNPRKEEEVPRGHTRRQLRKKWPPGMSSKKKNRMSSPKKEEEKIRTSSEYIPA
jgi:hypothetical protein